MTSEGAEFSVTERTRLKRIPKRGFYDKASLYAVLDEALTCHVGFVFEGSPVVIPTIHWREEDRLYIHGAASSRMLTTLAQGAEACITVTLTDGLVLARSAFHHSMNYRSVVIFGQGEDVPKPEKKFAHLAYLMHRIAPGRWDEARQPNGKELKATRVIGFDLNEASGKVRTGMPVDDDEDMQLSVWAGVLPLSLQAGVPIPDPKLGQKIELPAYLEGYNPAQ